MPDYDDPDDDERVVALQQVLRRNGVGGPAPFTIEGEIAQMGNIGRVGASGRGWRRGAALIIAMSFLVPFLLAVVAELVHLLTHGVG